jgi:hypothetical protein
MDPVDLGVKAAKAYNAIKQMKNSYPSEDASHVLPTAPYSGARREAAAPAKVPALTGRAWKAQTDDAIERQSNGQP